MHTLVTIGYLGDKRCYLDISKEEAILRYKAENPDIFDEFNDPEFDKNNVKEIKFEDQFSVYDAW